MNTPDLLSWLAMGGYGLYVWGSLGMCAAALAAELLSLRAQRRALIAQLAAEEAPAAPVRQPVLTRQEAA